MDLKEIKRLITMVEEANISALSVEEDNRKIEIKKEFGATIAVPHVTNVAHHPVHAHVPLPTPAAAVSSPATPAAASADSGQGKAIKSPMVGTFYRAANPDSPPYKKPGDTVEVGDVVCIVEAMKLYNEIESEVAGVIEKVLVENGAPVEYGQALFVLRA